jgi:hypothetical protein
MFDRMVAIRLWWLVVGLACTRIYLANACEQHARHNSNLESLARNLITKYDAWDPDNSKKWGVRYDPGVFLRRWVTIGSTKILSGSLTATNDGWQGYLLCEVESQDLRGLLRRLRRISRGVIVPHTITIKRNHSLLQVKVSFLWLI